MKTANKNTKVSFYTIFKELLHEFGRSESIGNIYANLFSLRTEEELEEDLAYLYTLYKGTDSYWKKDSVDDWFAIWHKSIRQCDYFHNCFQTNTVELVTADERAKFKFIGHKVRTEGYDKKNGKDPNKLFNDEYNEYLNLHSKIRREDVDDSINGRLDSMLWNLVHVDEENKLMKLFRRTFLTYEDKI